LPARFFIQLPKTEPSLLYPLGGSSFGGLTDYSHP